MTMTQEVTKFLSGVFFGDFAAQLWLWKGGYLPMTAFHIQWDVNMVAVTAASTLAVTVFLAMHGWSKL